ncbi:MAG: ABC transporter permease [Deltaproteobacteria bacterium]|nr:ABC transporter permease [Deltaproteobacteria bacterium]
MHPLRGFLALIERECYRFGGSTSIQTIATPVLTTALFILIFGYSLGSQIKTISSFSYILYILPGLTGMAVLSNSYSNSSTSLFMARIDQSIENIITSPLSPTRIVIAFVIGGMIRGVIVGTVILLVASVITPLSVSSIFLTGLNIVIGSLLFSSLGIISGLMSEEWDQLALVSNFIITPLTYLGGVFYSVQMLPSPWQGLSHLNPIFYLIDGFRYSILGISDISPAISFPVGIGLAVLVLTIAIQLFRSGYKIIT